LKQKEKKTKEFHGSSGPALGAGGRVFIFRDLQLGHLSKEQVVDSIEATNIDNGGMSCGKYIYNLTTFGEREFLVVGKYLKISNHRLCWRVERSCTRAGVLW
jgi:hypothetical protein